MSTQRTGPYEPARPEGVMPGRAETASNRVTQMEDRIHALESELRRIATALEGKMPGCSAIPTRIRKILRETRGDGDD